MSLVPVIVEAAPGVIDVPAEPQFRIEPVAAAPEEYGLLIDLGLVQRRIDRERQDFAAVSRDWGQ